MYRLAEENNRIIERRNRFSPDPPGNTHQVVRSKGSPTRPTLPYDELQMDRSQQRLRMRSHFIEGSSNLGEEQQKQQQQHKQQQQEPPQHLEHPPQLEIMDTSTVSVKRGDDMDNSINSNKRPPIDRRRGRGRKSHPWETDVKLNRFSGSGAPPNPRPCSRTQQSTWGWKQRMQERRAVFSNVAVLEQSFDEDDTLLDDDDESRGEGDAEQIREEAVELLRSKGFHNFQGILQQQYDDDLESVGGSVSIKNNKQGPLMRHTLRLEEIQSLRQKILRNADNQQESCDTLPEVEDEPFDQKQSGITRPVKAAPPEPAPEDNADAVKAWRVMKQLKSRLESVFTEDYYVVEAMGRRGVGSPPETKIIIDENAFARHKLRDAVEQRVSQLFTGDHHIVCNGEIQLDSEEASVIQESLSGDTGAFMASPNDKSQNSGLTQEEEEENDAAVDIKSPELRERLSDSFLVFESMMRARQQAAVQEIEDDDEWTECEITVAESTIRGDKDMLPNLATTDNADGDDDQSCYSEYTIDTSSFQSGIRNTIVSTETAPAESTSGSGDFKTIKVDDTHTANDIPVFATSNQEASSDDDDSYAEYTIADDGTVQEQPFQAMAAPFRLPGQAQLPVQSRRNEDDQSYMEFTVRDGDSQPSKQFENDDQSYMEMTVQDSESPPTRLPPKRQDPSDDQSYMEVTVADHSLNPSALVAPPDLTSPHLTSMLSSRMFADMQLPAELQQQQPPQRGLEDNDASYPTITIEQDDDDMTQITFDQTIDETIIEMPDHQYATQHLDNSSKSKETLRSSFHSAGDMTSVACSHHTEQTRDTTVSDDASSQQDVASFKSCISSESSQYVAELLRRDIWSPDGAVVETALEKLEQEAVKGFHERSNIVRYGGLLALIRVMEMKPDRASIQLAAFSALEKMATDASIQVSIGEVGGISAIANSMQGHKDDVDVQRAACKTLASLTRHRDGGSVLPQDPIPTEGVVETVVSCMTKHPNDAHIQEHAFATLANLCLDNQARLRELKKTNGLAAMTMALQVTWTSQTDHHEAISTLSILLRSLSGLEQN